MTAKEIRDLSAAEISNKLRASREELLMSRLKKQTGTVAKTHTFRALRKDIARLETIKKQKAAKAA
jgi:large subunit ribosomal protein L29